MLQCQLLLYLLRLIRAHKVSMIPNHLCAFNDNSTVAGADDLYAYFIMNVYEVSLILFYVCKCLTVSSLPADTSTIMYSLMGGLIFLVIILVMIIVAIVCYCCG